MRDRYGPPDVVRVEDVPAPSPGPGDVRVRVHVATVNRTDVGYRAGTPWFLRLATGLRPRDRVLGTELAGVVETLGADVTGYAVGDRVFAYVEGTFGAHAELTVVPVGGMLAHVPAGVDLARAAAATEGAHYALSMIRRAGVRAGQDVLVHGATGAIGSAAVQLLHAAGARVTAVCPPEHVDLVRSLGADVVLPLGAPGPVRSPAFSAVLDAVGKSSFRRYRRFLTPDGTYTSSELGHLGQNVLLALLGPLSRGRRVVFPLPMAGPEVMQDLRDRLASGALVPVLDRAYPLEEVVEAYRYVESGTKVGSVLLAVTRDAVSP